MIVSTGLCPRARFLLLMPLLLTKHIQSEPVELKNHPTIYSSDQSSSGIMFDLKVKNDLVIYGLDINTPLDKDNSMPIQVWTKTEGFSGYEMDESAWSLVFNSSVIGKGLDVPTPILSDQFDPVVVKSGMKQSFYVTFVEAPYIRYTTFDLNDKMYYINEDIIIYAKGSAKRKGFSGGVIYPRVFNGGIKYLLGSEPLEVTPQTIAGLPTVSPTVSSSPTNSPTKNPTAEPTRKPTFAPTMSPMSRTKIFTTAFDSDTTYAGLMFDIVAKSDIKIKGLGFNTYLTGDVDVQVWTRRGSYEKCDKDLSKWVSLVNITVQGQGLDNPTLIPQDSFRHIQIPRTVRHSFYITTTQPYLRATKGTFDGKEANADSYLILYAGVGKRYPIENATTPNRVMNGVITYEPIDIIPTEVDTDGLETAAYSFVPTDASYIQEGVDSPIKSKVQMLVDGIPKRITLLHFDLSALSLSTTVVKRAKLRLFAMSDAPSGGKFSVFPDGSFNEETVTWANSPYSIISGVSAGKLNGPITEKTFYLLDITYQFASRIPSSIVIRIESDESNGVMYRSPLSAENNGPELQIVFASEPRAGTMNELFGTQPPTGSPTTDPKWENPPTMLDPPDDYFNYNPKSIYGPNRWDQIEQDRFYERYDRLKESLWNNQCIDGGRQSPRDLCETQDKCSEFHQARPRAGEYDIDDGPSTRVKPTPYIMHNKLRLTYKTRRSEWERPEPPGTDFAHNVFNSGIQDLVHIDLKVKSEHRLCSKQYDAEMQLFHFHSVEHNLEATGILIEADGSEGENPHFQKLLDFFQKKFDADRGMCKRRQLLAKKLFEEKKSDKNRNRSNSKLRGLRGEKKELKTEQINAESIENGDVLHGIVGRFLGAVQRRSRRDWVWDPQEPWYILRSIHFWGYYGSITEPPCFEDVNWRIIDVPMKISPGQYIQLKKLMFSHVDPDTCKYTSTHFDESNARPVQPYRGGKTYRCRRSDYVSDKEREYSGRRRGFEDPDEWRGVGLLPWIEGEFPDV